MIFLYLPSKTFFFEGQFSLGSDEGSVSLEDLCLCVHLVLPASLPSQVPRVGKLMCRLHTQKCEQKLSSTFSCQTHFEVVLNGLTTLDLVGQHALHGLPEDVLEHLKVQEIMRWVGVYIVLEEDQGLVLPLNSVEIARNVNVLTARDHHFPAQQYLPGHSGFQVVALEMVATIELQDLPFCQLWQLPWKFNPYIYIFFSCLIALAGTLVQW